MKNKKRERIEIRIDPETNELLNSLVNRTNSSITSIIKQSLKVYAGTLKKGHVFTIKYKCEEIQDYENIVIEDIEEKPQTLKEDELPF